MADFSGHPQVVAGPDPRFRRRWIEVRRRQGRRRLYVLGGLIAVTGTAATGWAALHSPVLDVDVVRVTGAGRTPAAEVVAVSGVPRGHALIDVDPEAVRAAVGRLPWVLRAKVTRQWPGSVSIAVTERVPVAAARAGEQSWALVDAEGRVLATVAEPPPGLPPVSGTAPVGVPGTRLGSGWEAVLRVAAATPPPLLDRVSAIAEADNGGVELTLAPGAVVRFGLPEQVDEKFTAISTVLARVDTKDLAVLDVRIPRTPALTRRETTARVSTRAAG